MSEGLSDSAIVEAGIILSAREEALEEVVTREPVPVEVDSPEPATVEVDTTSAPVPAGTSRSETPLLVEVETCNVTEALECLSPVPTTKLALLGCIAKAGAISRVATPVKVEEVSVRDGEVVSILSAVATTSEGSLWSVEGETILLSDRPLTTDGSDWERLSRFICLSDVPTTSEVELCSATEEGRFLSATPVTTNELATSAPVPAGTSRSETPVTTDEPAAGTAVTSIWRSDEPSTKDAELWSVPVALGKSVTYYYHSYTLFILCEYL
jgi:hypothetical protein